MSETLTVQTFTFEDGTTLRDVPVSYQTWGTLNAAGDNAVLVCHASPVIRTCPTGGGRFLGGIGPSIPQRISSCV